MGAGVSQNVQIRPLVAVEKRAPTIASSALPVTSPLSFDQSNDQQISWEAHDDIEQRWVPLHATNAELLEKASSERRETATILLGPTRNLMFHVNLKTNTIDKTGKAIRRTVSTSASDFTTPAIAPHRSPLDESPTGLFKNLRHLKHHDKMFTGRLSPGGEFAVSGGADKIIRMWDTAGATERSRFPVDGQVLSVDFSTVHQVLAVTTDGCALHVFDYTGNVLDLRGKNTSTHTSRVYCVRFLRNDRATAMITCDLSGAVYLWDVQTLVSFDKASFTSSAIYSLSAGDGATYSAGCDDGVVRVCDIRSPTLAQNLMGHSATVWGVDIDTTNNLAVSCGMDQTCKIWDLRTMSCVQTFAGHGHSVHHCCFAGANVASVGRNNQALLWPICFGATPPTPGVLGTISHSHFVTHVHYDKDSKEIMTSSFDKTCVVAKVGA